MEADAMTAKIYDFMEIKKQRETAEIAEIYEYTADHTLFDHADKLFGVTIDILSDGSFALECDNNDTSLTEVALCLAKIAKAIRQITIQGQL